GVASSRRWGRRRRHGDVTRRPGAGRGAAGWFEPCGQTRRGARRRRRRRGGALSGGGPRAGPGRRERAPAATRPAGRPAPARATARVRCWGENVYGQIGIGTTGAAELKPLEVTGLGVVQRMAAADHTCAVLADQTLACWGRNDSGQVGDGTTDPRSLPVAVAGL